MVVDITDVSDHGPKFQQGSYNTSVFENLPLETIVLTVEATDDDLVCLNSLLLLCLH